MKPSDFFTIKRIGNSVTTCREVTINWDTIWSIPEFEQLKTTPQSPKWHSESQYVDGHVIRVIEGAVNLLTYPTTQLNDFEAEVFLLAAIFHDVGKCNTTKFKEKDGSWHHYGHEVESAKITRRILWDTPITTREAVYSLVRHHMDIYGMQKVSDPCSEMIRLSYQIPSWKLLIMLNECDTKASLAMDSHDNMFDEYRVAWLYSMANSLNIMESCSNTHELIRYMQRHMLNRPKVHVDVYIGLPGAGKDTHIDSTFRDIKYVSISRDEIRIELGYCAEGEKYLGTEKEEKEVSRVFNEKLLKAAADGENIVINNTNLKKKYRDAYKELLKEYNVVWHYIYIEAYGLEKNIERRKGQINPPVFYNMMDTMDFPHKNEYDTLQIIQT